MLKNTFAVLLALMIALARPAVPVASGEVSAERIKGAAAKALALIEKSSVEYLAHRECFSCHHQALPLLALVEAQQRGFTVDTNNLRAQLQHTADHLDRGKKDYVAGRGQGGKADTAGYALWALEAGGWAADETTRAVGGYLTGWQRDADHWRSTSNRPPSEASDFATTYLALRGLAAFGPEDQADLEAARRESARKWMLAAKAHDTEDRVFRLRTLHYLGEEAAARQAAAELIDHQHPDGGWRQNDALQSDAYATGTVLVALHQTGAVARGDPVYQRGLEFLVGSQLEDGSWHVRSRSKPFQLYFESGFPHGKDQFISIAASCWAATALVLAAPAADSPAPTDASSWKVGLASVDITPSEPTRMSGYSSRTEPSQGIAHPLYAKCLAIEDGQGNRALLITSDVIGFAAAFTEPTCRRISEQTGLERSQILLNSSHTHAGPTLELNEAQLDYAGEQAEATVRYTQALQNTLVQLAQTALNRLEPVELSWGVGVAEFVMNRREFTDRGVQLGVNPRGLVDRSVPVLRVASPGGTLRGVLFGAACHNTTLTGDNLKISGDFAGYAQTQIERHHPGAQAMFMQGCAGDANPHPRGTEELARLHGTALGDEVLRVLQTGLAPIRGPLRTERAQVDLPLQPPLEPEQIQQLGARGSWHQFVADKMREVIDAGGELPTRYRTSLAVWQFGEDLTLVALPGEVVVDYVTLLERALGPRSLWIAAYSNDVFGYLPSARVLEEGGYETRGLYRGGIGFFSPGAQDAVVQAVRGLAEKVRRAMPDKAAPRSGQTATP